MPETGGFATGLARGVFGELSAQKAQREKEVTEQKKQTLDLLTGLLSRAEPESQPALLRHIGDVIGLKGNQQGIWARLTGADTESDKGALAQKLQEVLGQVAGPTPTRQQPALTGTTRLKGTPFDLPLPKIGYEQVAAPEKREPGKIYLRDPEAFELEKIKSRYALQGEAALERLREREALGYQRQSRLQEDRQAFEKEMLERRTLAKAESKVMEQAAIIANKNRRPITDADKAEAADQVEQDMGLQRGYLREKLKLVGAQTKLAEFQAQTDPATGLPMGKAPTVQQNRMFGLAQTREARIRAQEAEGLRQRYVTAYTLANKIGGELQAAYKRIEASPYFYKDGKLYNKSTGQELTPAQQSFYGGKSDFGFDLQGLRKLEEAKKAAMATMKSQRDELVGKYPDLYEGADPGGWELRQKQAQPETGPQPQGAAPQGGPPVSQKLTGRPPQGKLPPVGQVTEWISPNRYIAGDAFPVGKAKMVVREVIGESPDGKFRYKIVRTK